MKSVIRVVKNGTRVLSETIQPAEETKMYRQANRDMVANVKTWITQTKQRQRDEERKLAALLK